VIRGEIRPNTRALLLGARGTLLNERGLFWRGAGGGPGLSAREWAGARGDAPQPPRVSLAWPRTANEAELDRAAGCLLGQVIGDSLGALVAHFGEVEHFRSLRSEHQDRGGVNTGAAQAA
jgi:hypothetical protein